MKCHSCGREVVISTELCPWCGYKYSFDGSAVKKDPIIYDKGPSDVERERRREKREARAAREAAAGGHARWTESGVFSDTKTSGAADARPTAEPAAGAGAKSMRWYRFLVSLLLPLNILGYIYSGAVTITDSVSSLAGDGGAILVLAPWIPMLQLAVGVIYIVFAVLAVSVRRQLKNMKWSGVRTYNLVVLLPALVNFAANVAWMAYLELYPDLLRMNFSIVFSVLYVILNSIYFRKRREMFD